MKTAGESAAFMKMDSLQAPLIANRDPNDDDADLENHTVPNGPGAETSPGLFMWLLTLSAGISGLLFGCRSCHLLAAMLAAV